MLFHAHFLRLAISDLVFGVRSGFISGSVRARLQVSVCSGYFVPSWLTSRHTDTDRQADRQRLTSLFEYLSHIYRSHHYTSLEETRQLTVIFPTSCSLTPHWGGGVRTQGLSLPTLTEVRIARCVRCGVSSDPIALFTFCVMTQQNATFWGAHPGGYNPQIRTRPRFLYNAPTLKFYHPMFTRSEVMVLTNKQTNRRRLKHPTLFATLRRWVKTIWLLSCDPFVQLTHFKIK